MDEENKKINLESFFKKVDSVEQIANSALSRSNSNLGIINNQKALIESLSISIEAMQTKIRDIANYIIVEKKLEADREEDRRLETEDAEQKRQMDERAAAMGQQGPQKEPVKPAESQGGGGSFLGGLIKTLGGLMVGGFALKYIAPVILPKLLLLAKTKLLPLIGTGLKSAVGTSFKFIGGMLARGFLPLVGIRLIGKAFKPVMEGIKGTFDSVSNFFSGKIDSIFKGGGGDGGTGVSSDSNMGATDSTVETGMADTLTEEGLVEEDSDNEEMEEFDEEVNELKEESAIAEETGQEDISGELRKQASGDDEELAEEVGKKFKVTKEERNQTKEEQISFHEKNIKRAERAIARTKNARKKQNALNSMHRSKKALRELGVEEYKSYGSNVTEKERIESVKSLIESGKITATEVKESATIEKTKIEPIDLSLKQNQETTDKLTNVLINQTGTESKSQNNDVMVQSKPARTTIASIKKTNSNIAFIKATKNQYLSINETELPPEVARMIT